MKNELQEEFYKKYPDLFREKDLSMEKTCMCWGICFSDGWSELLDDLCQKLIIIQKTSGVQIIFAQLKEKFGTLRAYIDTIENKELSEEDNKLWWSIIHSVIGSAENTSSHTCEVCGKYGKLRQGGWWRTLCDEHVIKKEVNEKDTKKEDNKKED